MIVRCLFTEISNIKDERLKQHVAENVHLDDIGLSPQADYKVYGVIFRSGACWYYLCDDLNAQYPTPYCSEFFQIIDPEIPAGWHLIPGCPSFLVPSKWAKIPNFLEKLVDGQSDAVSAFEEIRQM